MTALTVTNAFGDVELTVGPTPAEGIPPIAVTLRTGQAYVAMYLEPEQARQLAAKLVEVAGSVESARKVAA